MALKNRRTAAAAAETRPEMPDMAEPEEDEPYMVFGTKADYDKAVADELAKQTSQQPQNEPPVQTAPDDDRERRIALWRRDAYMLKLVVPDFDFEAALKSDSFRAGLAAGRTVFEAYASMVKPEHTERSEIFQNAQSASRGTGESAVNPAKLSSEEFKKYIDRIRNR